MVKSTFESTDLASTLACKVCYDHGSQLDKCVHLTDYTLDRMRTATMSTHIPPISNQVSMRTNGLGRSTKMYPSVVSHWQLTQLPWKHPRKGERLGVFCHPEATRNQSCVEELFFEIESVAGSLPPTPTPVVHGNKRPTAIRPKGIASLRARRNTHQPPLRSNTWADLARWRSNGKDTSSACYHIRIQNVGFGTAFSDLKAGERKRHQ